MIYRIMDYRFTIFSGLVPQFNGFLSLQAHEKFKGPCKTISPEAYGFPVFFKTLYTML